MTQEEYAEALCATLGKQVRACVESARRDERAAKCPTPGHAADWWRAASPADRRVFLGLIGAGGVGGSATVYPGE